MNDEKCIVPVPTMSARIAPLTSTGGGGTTDYNKLRNKPSVNGIELEGNKTLEDLGIQPTGEYALKTDIPSVEGLATEEYVDGKIDEVKQEIPNVSSFITNAVDDLVNYYKKDETYTQEQIDDKLSDLHSISFKKVDVLPSAGESNIIYLVPREKQETKNAYDEYIWDNGWEKIGSTDIDLTGYATETYVNEQIQNLVDGDIDNLTELIKELQDKKEIYVGYISSVTPGRETIEEILSNAIKSGAGTLILRPTVDLPQDFTAIGSGPNLQKYKNGGKGFIKFTDVNEHTTINAMPSVISYVTTVSFSVITEEDNIDVSITDVQTKFISGINSTSQQAYVIHTKNEEPFTPTGPYQPAVKKTVDDAIEGFKSEVLTRDNTTEYEPETDYNPATKKYADSIKNDIPVALSQLKNDLWNEAKSREEAQTLSQQNPGKFYFCQEKEESEE